MHVLELDELYDPAPQSTQLPVAESPYLPATQGPQDDALLLTEKAPVEQAAHAVNDVDPVFGFDLPAPQSKQFPVAESPYLPDSHGGQDAALLLAENVPVEHVAQAMNDVDPVFGFDLPAPQSSQLPVAESPYLPASHCPQESAWLLSE